MEKKLSTFRKGKIVLGLIEDAIDKTANYIKYQIMDLLLNGKIEDTPNEFDSRDFKSLKEERYW